jgi:phenylacetate-coenzyme A ligase PaaK-like adenylate-forming protein
MASARLARDLPRFSRVRIEPAAAATRVKARLEARDRTFLERVDRFIWAERTSPYRWLFQVAGCDPGDVRALVDAEGLDAALAILARRGVFVTNDEARGTIPLVRGSQRAFVTPSSFDNPTLAGHICMQTSGSTGTPNTVQRSLWEFAESADTVAISHRALGISRPDLVAWFTGPHTVLRLLPACRAFLTWASPVGNIPRHVAAARWALAATARISGAAWPWPTVTPMDDVEGALGVLRDAMARSSNICVSSTTSIAGRMSAAAMEAGVSLAGVTWQAAGEPLTAARLQTITASGAGVCPVYAAVEAGSLASACGNPRSADDLHLALDRQAVFQHTRESAVTGTTVQPLLVTTLSRWTPKVMLNYELGDSATLDQHRCGCYLDEIGLCTHIRNIRSFEKLTSEGMTFHGADVVALVEVVLPRLFGGHVGDYQLIESEATDGAARLTLRVNPRLPAIEAEDIQRAVLGELGGDSTVARYMREALRAAGTLSIERRFPEVGPSGKVAAFVPRSRG